MNFIKTNFIMSICLVMTSMHTVHGITTPRITDISLFEPEALAKLAREMNLDTKHESCNDNDTRSVKAEAQIGVDLSGNPIKLAYRTWGQKPNHNENKLVIVIWEPYMGQGSMNCTGPELADKLDAYVIATDQLGYGKSTRHTPTALDGVDFGQGVPGVVGYSFDQYAISYHKFLQVLGINDNQQIMCLSVDTQSEVAIKYHIRYKNDPLALKKLVIVNASAQSIISDDPCQLAYVNTAIANQIVQAYKNSPQEIRCAILCQFLLSSFQDVDCPETGRQILNDSVKYAANDADIFERNFLTTIAEDVSPHLKDIDIPTMFLWSVTDFNNSLYRQAQGIYFAGYCPSCQNPNNPETCTSTSYIKPIPNIEVGLWSNYNGTACWRTKVKPFNKAVKKFFAGRDVNCTVCDKDTDVPQVCAPCA